MIIFHQYHMARARISPVRVLARMLQSGKYYASASWAMTAFGKGMHPEKFNAIWKCLIMPE